MTAFTRLSTASLLHRCFAHSVWRAFLCLSLVPGRYACFMTSDVAGGGAADGPGVRGRAHPERAPRWRRLLLMLVALHAVLTAFSLFSPLLTGQPRGQSEFSVYFDVSYEGNFPTWWSVAQLSAAATALIFAAVLSRSQRAGGTAAWWVLAGLVLLLGLNEGTAVYERMDRIASQFISVDDFTFLWLVVGIPAGALLLITAAVSARSLPEECTKLVILGFALLIFAAVGLEFVVGELIRLAVPTGVTAVIYHLAEFLALTAGALLLAAPLAALRLQTAHGLTRLRILGHARDRVSEQDTQDTDRQRTETAGP